MNIRLSATALAVASLFPLAASADTQGDEVVVTATRTARTVDESLSSVSVITRADIEREQARSVPELLRGLAGVSVTSNGGMGKTTSLFLRGTESDHTLVLVDGVKVGSATLGTAALQDLPIEQIERIEIVRGPRSSLYGSEAIGGVIQIFTKRGGGATTPWLSFGAGTQATRRAAAGVSGGGEHAWYSASASGVRTDGFNACREDAAGVGGCFVDEPDRDGYRAASGSARAGYRFDNGAELDFNWLRTRAENEYDGSFQNRSVGTEEVAGGRFSLSPLAWWKLTAALGQSRDLSDNFKGGSFQNRFDTTRNSASVQNDLTLGGDLLTVGADYLQDRIGSTVSYPVTSRENTGVFAQYQGAFGAHDVEASLRHDDNEQFGSKTTGGLAWGYPLTQHTRITASYGTAFKAPTFNELYYPFFGNPDLKPESSRTAELGLRGKAGAVRWTVAAYETHVDDLIGFDASFTPRNIDQARIRGLETTARVSVADWDLGAQLTLLDPKNRSGGAFDGNLLPRRPQQSLRLDLDRAFGALRLGATLLAEGRRYDDLANQDRLGGFATMDLRAEYAIDKSWRVQATVANLFDKDYETAEFFPMPGRSAFVTVRYQPAH